MPSETSFLNRLRALMGVKGVARLWGDAVVDDPVALSHRLLTARGEASGAAIADRILMLVEKAEDTGLRRFFAALRDEFEVDLEAVLSAAERAREDGTALKTLQLASEPPRQELFRRLNAAPRGTVRLVNIRQKLLRALKRDATLAPIDSDLRHLLRSWFNRGFLVPARIDWDSSANLLEKIIAYEAVHAIDTWDALRERLVPDDRRCFAFFHPAMPDEPLIFVEVALTRGLADSIDDILAAPRKGIMAAEADTAIFYSISNCQPGLAGISFGAFLIKQVAADLKVELPNLSTFSTLSPVPGLSRWTETQGVRVTDTALPAIAAAFLAEAKDGSGRPVDPVAKFHLGNGAELHRINTGADLSAKGKAQSHGVMVNYRYELDRVEMRHEAFVEDGTLALSRSVKSLLTKARPWEAPPQPERHSDDN